MEEEEYRERCRHLQFHPPFSTAQERHGGGNHSEHGRGMRGSKTLTNSLWDTDTGDNAWGRNQKPSEPVWKVEEAEGVLREKKEGDRQTTLNHCSGILYPNYMRLNDYLQEKKIYPGTFLPSQRDGVGPTSSLICKIRRNVRGMGVTGRELFMVTRKHVPPLSGKH